MQTTKLKTTEIQSNPDNPRIIRDDKFLKLVQSIKDFPEMLKLRPIVVNEQYIVIGGNQRFKACKEAGLKEIDVMVATGLTPEQEKEFIIKDNVSAGQWDWGKLETDFEIANLSNFGIDTEFMEVANDFKANTSPTTKYSDVTTTDIERANNKLESQMYKEEQLRNVICPHCEQEFKIEQ